MAARPLRRAICAGTKKSAAVAPAVVALQRLPRYCFALRSFRYKRDLSACYGHARAILGARMLFCYAVLLRFVVLHYRPLALRAFGRRLAPPRKTSRFAALVKF